MNKEQGLSILEPIIALALFSTIISAVLAVAFGAQNLMLDSQTKLEALTLSQSALENAQSILKQNWFAELPQPTNSSIYRTEVKSSGIDDYTKQLTVTTSWSVGQRSENLIMTSMITDWKSAMNDSVCGPLSGNWANPQVLSTVDLGASNPATAVAAKSNLLYITTDSSTQSKPDFFIFDISNPQNLTLLSSLNTGPGVSSIAVAGNYVFLGNTSINGQLEVIDITNPSSPVLMKTYKLPGVYSDNTTIPNTLIYSRSKIYLGTAKSQIAEFHMIDVSNPLVPAELGSFEINAGINALNAQNNTVFVASPANEEVKVLDVSSPGAIRQIGGYDAPGGSGNGKSLSRNIDTLFLGRTLGGNELIALNIENLASLQVLNSKALGTSINGIIAKTNLAFLITNDANKKFQIWNINPINSPALISSLNPNSTLTGIACQHNLIFITTTTPDGFSILGPG